MNAEAPSIHEASRTGDIDTVRQLLADDPTLVDADDQHQWRPIFHAGLYKHEDIVRLLIESGADLSAHDGYVLHYAGEVPDNKPIVRLLIQYGALDAHVLPKNDLQRQFLAAVFLGDQTRVAAMLGLHPELATTIEGRGDQPIHHAARNGDLEIVKLLLDHGADVDAMSERRNSVLYCAAGHGHGDTMKLLLDRGVDVNAKFSKNEITIQEWLAQFPDDQRFQPIAKMLASR